VSELTILGYHSFSPTWPAETNVTPANLERQLAWLARRGYRAATLSEALADPGDGRTVVLTFDDAHHSVLEQAVPMLERHGFVGTVFAATDYVDSGEPMGWPGYDIWLGTEHEDELRPMSWEDLAGLRERNWEVGSHTLSHPRLPQIDDDGRLAEELESSKRRCEERLEAPCPTLAYPYGDHDARVRAATEAAGYMAAVSLPTTAEAPEPMAWPRVGVYLDDSLWRLRLRIWRRRRGAGR
jgi:peptidoglycan/xylan/chitin deacetylase (PgdA/CDA1 family)